MTSKYNSLAPNPKNKFAIVGLATELSYCYCSGPVGI
jgi:hypothetical protein